MSENMEVYEIWVLCCTQWRSNGFTLFGIDLPAVFQIADIYGIEITPGFILKIKALENFELARFQSNGGDDDGK